MGFNNYIGIYKYSLLREKSHIFPINQMEWKAHAQQINL
ncbi:hypothetical protein CPter91_5223 [Collimonas pratensis]|uniref:Uncharacterized protein n=1 Tax=Collimonas pratensis TaxID=279113 RepID=A0A127QD08_9BURK|nr:hypothetical protein CPter91_5223 [Collimonas pratensis]